MGKSPYLIYGRRTVAEFFAAGHEPAEVTRGYVLPDMKATDLGLPEGSGMRGWVRTDRRRLDEQFPDINHQGVVLALPSGRTPHKGGRWTEFVRERSGVLVLLSELQDPQNVGAIIRTSEALGAAGVLLTPKCAPLSPTVDRASAGASFHIPLFEDVGVGNLLQTASKAGYWIVASSGETDPSDRRGMSHTQTDRLPPAADCLLVIGSEGSGVRRLIAERADFIVHIALRGRVRSLNASAAAAMLLDRVLNR